LRQPQPPLQRVERLRQFERRRGERPEHFGEDEFVLVDVAERHDARQDRGVVAGDVEENVAREPAGAAGREIDRGAAERQRIGAVGKAFDQLAVAQRADQHRQERRGGGDVEDVGVRRGHRESRFARFVRSVQCKAARV
jgi:hypothetical protein